MGKMYRNINQAELDMKERDRKLHRAKHYHPQLNDDVKREILRESKRNKKLKTSTYTQQRKIKSSLYLEDTD